MAGSESVRLTNADFRKFVSTTNASSRASNAKGSKHNQSSTSTPRSSGNRPKAAVKSSAKQDDELSLANIMQKYRDRAKERRGTTNGGPASLADASVVTDTTAVVPPVNMNKFPLHNIADQKRMQVEQSKYLGGDMEHTHLVRGLDYALLQKVRAEMEQESEKHAETDESRTKTDKSGTELRSDAAAPTFNSRLARDVYDLHFNMNYPERNELFMPGRMCFEYDLQDPEFAGTPTVLVRSKAELKLDDSKTVSTTDLVIDKLTEIFAYMRRGLRATKQPKRQRTQDQWTAKPSRPVDPRDAAHKDSNIFDDVDDVDDDDAANRERDKHSIRRSSDRRDDKYSRASESRDGASKHEVRQKTGSYFHKPGADSTGRKTSDSCSSLAAADDDITERQARLVEMNRELARLRSDDTDEAGPDSRGVRKRKGIADQSEDSYAECYPDYDVSSTANDSDEEDMPVDQQMLAKTDGSKKSQLSRWDFESQEDYSKYMSQLEATPKAAFQFGQKMNDGRKSRKALAAKGEGANEKVKYDQQWTKIQKIIETKKDTSAKRSAAV